MKNKNTEKEFHTLGNLLMLIELYCHKGEDENVPNAMKDVIISFDKIKVSLFSAALPVALPIAIINVDL